MELQNANILQITQTLRAWGDVRGLPVVLSLKLARMLQTMEREANIIGGQRDKIIEEFAARDENGRVMYGDNGAVRIQAESYGECSKRLAELGNLSTDINIVPLTISEKELEQIAPTANEITAMGNLLQIQGEEDHGADCT